MTTQAEWQAQVGRNWSEMYSQTDRAFTGLTQQLLRQIEELPGEHVLDIGCGAGELSLAISRARPQARITGIDISADLVEAAASRGGERDRVHFIQADAASWFPAHGEAGPDLLVSRHGVMFFENPEKAFSHFHTIAAPDANMIFSCFRTMDENPWASRVAAILPASLPPLPSASLYSPGPFAFGDAGLLRTILMRSGWRAIVHEAFDFAYVAGHGPDAIAEAEAFFSRIGPFAQALRLVDEDGQSGMRQRLRKLLVRHATGDIVAFPAAAWIVSARKA